MNMASRGEQHAGRDVVCCCLCLLLTGVTALAQSYMEPGRRDYNRGNVYVPQEVDLSEKTYMFKGRRYGKDYLDPSYRGPTRAPEDRRIYDVSVNSCVTHTCNFSKCNNQSMNHISD